MESLLHTAKEAALEAGAEIMKLYADVDFETKDDGSPVTIADRRANDVLIERLGTTGISILSEESENIALPYPDRLWIIDPIDGTSGFIKKNGDFAVMIGLLVKGMPVLGVIYEPTTKNLYYATKGHGAFLEKEGIVTPLKIQHSGTEIRFLQSRTHHTEFVESVIQKLGARSTICGGFGKKALCVAQGKSDFFFTEGIIGEWDVCAPSVIIEEAGGRATDIFGKEFVYGAKNHLVVGGAIISNGACHDSIVNAIAELR